MNGAVGVLYTLTTFFFVLLNVKRGVLRAPDIIWHLFHFLRFHQFWLQVFQSSEPSVWTFRIFIFCYKMTHRFLERCLLPFWAPVWSLILTDSGEAFPAPCEPTILTPFLSWGNCMRCLYCSILSLRESLQISVACSLWRTLLHDSVLRKSKPFWSSQLWESQSLPQFPFVP